MYAACASTCVSAGFATSGMTCLSCLSSTNSCDAVCVNAGYFTSGNSC